jgi:hypothetical protein
LEPILYFLSALIRQLVQAVDVNVNNQGNLTVALGRSRVLFFRLFSLFSGVHDQCMTFGAFIHGRKIIF